MTPSHPNLDRRRPAPTRPGLCLRPATADDSEAIWRWNNDPSIRRVSLDPRPIARADHERWMAARLTDPAHHMWIVEVIGEPIGVVRIARPDGGVAGHISIALDQAARGLGHGRAAIITACTLDGGPVLAEIVAENRASRACFEACGFTMLRTSLRPDGRIVLTYEWRNARATAT